MNTVLLMLTCVGSLVAAGVIEQDLWRMPDATRGVHSSMDFMSHEDLVRQKFLLDVLQHVQQPLHDRALLSMADSLVTDESRYMGDIDAEMSHVLRLARHNGLLGKHGICSITEPDHMRQLIGLYRLLVQSRDWDTFQRNVCHMREHVNGVLFVNVLLLAMRDRHDTQHLVVPAIHEILPELYVDTEIVRQIDSGNDWAHLMGRGDRRQPAWSTGRSHLDMTHRTGHQLWSPVSHIEKIILPIRGGGHPTQDSGLLSEDVGLMSWLHELIGEMCLKEGHTSQTLGSWQPWQREGSVADPQSEGRWGIGDKTDYRTMMLRGDQMRREHLPREDIRSGRLVYENRRNDEHMIVPTDMNWDGKMGMTGDRKIGGKPWHTVEDRQRATDDMINYRTMMTGSGIRGGHMSNERLDINWPTTDIRSDRLVHENRRRLNSDTMGRSQTNMNWDNTMGRRDIVGDSEMGDDVWQRHENVPRSTVDLLDETIPNMNTGRRASKNAMDWHMDPTMSSIPRHVVPMSGRRGVRTDDCNRWHMNKMSMHQGPMRRHVLDTAAMDKPLVGDSNMGASERMRHRSRRSLGSVDLTGHIVDDEMLLHNLQQLIARANIERVALGLHDIESSTDGRLITRIIEIEQRLQVVLEREIKRIAVRHGLADIHTEHEVNRVIGHVLLGNIENVGILQIIREILLATEDLHGHQTLGHVGVLQLRDPIVLHLLTCVMERIEQSRQLLLGADRWQLHDIRMPGVVINRVQADALRTHLEPSDMDLSNLLQTARIDETTTKMLVVRHERLNHREFDIRVDITADRKRPVLMRTILIPLIAGRGHEQENALLLDTAVIELHSGRNTIRRNSRDLGWTARDTTTMTEMYRHVMMALAGHIQLSTSELVGQTCRFPHRLLLPRGTTQGLPMQLMIVLTPIQRAMPAPDMLGQHTMCGIGVSSQIGDELPLMFPLGSGLSVADIRQLPNVHVSEVLIRHVSHIRND